MKYYIENSLKYYSDIFPDVESVLEHMFATLGNGITLDNNGWLKGNYKCEESYEFPEPQPLKFIYPWTKTERHQPFRELAGCRDKGFKKAVEHFIECVRITPDDVEDIKDWKENLHVVEDVLLNTPSIVDEFGIDDMDLFLKKIKGSKTTSQHPLDGTKIDAKNSVYKKWFFDVQWSDCPQEVEAEVRESWSDYELGNDYYIWKADVDEELFESYPKIYFWLKHKGVQDGEDVIVHWWW